MTTIGQIAGIDHISATRLRKAGIKTGEALLALTLDTDSLRMLSEETGINYETLVDVARSIELLQLEGMGGRYCALLRAAGIHTTAQLGNSSTEAVMLALHSANHMHRIVKRLPSPRNVEMWILQAAGQDSSVGG